VFYFVIQFWLSVLMQLISWKDSSPKITCFVLCIDHQAKHGWGAGRLLLLILVHVANVVAFD